ncbi:transmembrane protein 11, mitochondrial-like [Fukomys damarensis]|uniref:transmembrane protein 11, mitochondrial-like n=1 Tax=Fukomys damarensis TaxID=885580 RepID=UPI00053F35BE|nr:transmembrane protein 11, mitochondrial-like [Fukomys damarensis]
MYNEIHKGENAQDQCEYELEQVLEAQHKHTVLGPTEWVRQGTDTCLRLLCWRALPLHYSHYISLRAGVLSLARCTLYGISWHFDHGEHDAYKPSRLPLHMLTPSAPVVLVRKDYCTGRDCTTR